MKKFLFFPIFALIGGRHGRGEEENQIRSSEAEVDVWREGETHPNVSWLDLWKIDSSNSITPKDGKEFRPFENLFANELNLKNLNEALSLTNNILTRLSSNTAAPKEEHLVVSKGMQEVQKAFHVFSEPLMLPDDLKHFIDAIFNLGRNVDLTVALSGRWIKDFSESLEKVTQYTEAEDVEDHAASNMYVINIFELTKDLSNKVPYTNFLEFFDQKWMHNILSRLSEFVERLSTLVEDGKISAAKQLIEGSTIVDDLQLIRDYTREKAVDVIPGAVAKAIKAYKNQLLEVTWNQHFINTKQVEQADEEKPKNPQLLLLQLLQKRSDLANKLQALQAFVLEKFSFTYKYVESLSAKLEDLLQAMVPLPIAEKFQEKSMWEIFGQESSKVSAAQNLILQISQICSDFPIEEWNQHICKSFADVVSDQFFVSFSSVPRAMQQYFEVRGPLGSEYSNALPHSVMASEYEPFIRIPNMFPVLTTATTNAVDALVDSTQIVADSMIHTAADITERLRGSNSIINKQFANPPRLFRAPLILFEN